MSVATKAAKREEKQRRTEEETSLQLNYRSPPIWKRDKPMKNQNRENEEKDSDTPIDKKQKQQQGERK